MKRGGDGRRRKATVCSCLWLMSVVITLCPASMLAAPPYKTTDANTADPYVLEARIGLVQASRDGASNELLSPMLRANFGLPGKVELVSEGEYSQTNNAFENAALGVKWIPVFDQFSFGIETLALLPVRPNDNGYGVESQLVFTWRHTGYQIHVNAGGFHDPRGLETVDGWRGGVLLEKRSAGRREGIELFARQKRNQKTDLRLGYGLIHSVGNFEIRTGVHVGLSNQAPDVSINFWLSRELRLSNAGSK